MCVCEHIFIFKLCQYSICVHFNLDFVGQWEEGDVRQPSLFGSIVETDINELTAQWTELLSASYWRADGDLCLHGTPANQVDMPS